MGRGADRVETLSFAIKFLSVALFTLESKKKKNEIGHPYWGTQSPAVYWREKADVTGENGGLIESP